VFCLKLELFHEKKVLSTSILIIFIFLMLLLIAIALYQSYALFEQKKTYNIIKGSVPEQNFDTILSFVIQDSDGNLTSVKELPAKDNYYVDVSCTNDAEGIWDYDNWGLYIGSLKQSRTKCTLTFQPNVINPPIVASGSDNWIFEYPTVSFIQAGSAMNDIQHYEYYISTDTNFIPSDDTTPTGISESEITLKQDGTYYIFYRTVAKGGYHSNWSNKATYKIDTVVPVINMKNSGTYEIESKEEIATASFGGSGGKLQCRNVTVPDKPIVTNFISIRGIGGFEIECVATGNNGKLTKLSKTYQKEGNLTITNRSLITKTSNPSYYPGIEKLILPKGYDQYGPYYYAMAGCYKVEYVGSGFVNESCMPIHCYQNNPQIFYETLSLNITNTKISYYVNIPESLLSASPGNGQGLEFLLRNNCANDIIINYVRVMKATCP